MSTTSALCASRKGPITKSPGIESSTLPTASLLSVPSPIASRILSTTQQYSRSGSQAAFIGSLEPGFTLITRTSASMSPVAPSAKESESRSTSSSGADAGPL